MRPTRGRGVALDALFGGPLLNLKTSLRNLSTVACRNPSIIYMLKCLQKPIYRYPSTCSSLKRRRPRTGSKGKDGTAGANKR
jgi:hypothetical protein